MYLEGLGESMQGWFLLLSWILSPAVVFDLPGVCLPCKGESRNPHFWWKCPCENIYILSQR